MQTITTVVAVITIAFAFATYFNRTLQQLQQRIMYLENDVYHLQQFKNAVEHRCCKKNV